MKKKKVIDPQLEELMPLLINIWRRFVKIPGPPDELQTREFRGVVAAVKKLREGLDSGKSLIGTDYFANPELLGAYILYQWVIHYQEGLSLLGEIPTPFPRVLDLCSGPAPYAMAALKHGATEVIAFDQNRRSLELGSEICGRMGNPLNIRFGNALNADRLVEGKFDLIIAAHCIEELFPSTSKNWKAHQETFVKRWLRHLTPNGHFLIVDSSQLEANRRILELRDSLVRDHVPIQAPCVWKGECPALKTPNSPCYAQRELIKPYLIKEIQRAAEINLSSLKMSYILLRNPEAGWPVLPEEPLYRVISPPVDTFQGKRYYLCGTDGKKNLGSHLKEQPKDSRSFDFLKRGELIQVIDALENGSSLDIIEGTKVRIAAALGKPLPRVSDTSGSDEG